MNLAATIPVRPNAKSALVRWQEFQHRLPTETERIDWARRWPNANTALLTGSVSEIDVLDVDVKRNGEQSLRKHSVPPTLTVHTPSGGWHYYFAHPGFPVPCIPDLLPGCDLKADGGYVLVPPSAIDGRKYEVALNEPAAPMPAWLVELIQQRTLPRNGQRRLNETEIARLLQGVPEGARDVTATRLAGHYISKGLPAGEVTELLLAWNARNHPPLEDQALMKCVESVARTETRKRSSPIAFTAAISLTAQSVRWVWAGRIPLGTLTILAGMPGLGKSTLLTELVARLSRGQLEGDLHGTPITSIFATAEDSLTATVVPRLGAAGADLSRVHLPTDTTLLLPDHLDALVAWVARVGARVVILDPLVAHLSERVNSWRDQDVRRVLAPAVRLAEAADIAIAAVVHLNKTESSDIFSRVGGSIGIVAAARSLLLAAPDPQAADHDVRILAHAKSNLSLRAPSLRYRLEGRTITVAEQAISTSGIAWLGEASDVLVEDLLRPQSDDDRSERQEAASWLRELLTDRPRPPKEVFSEGKRFGFSERTIWRAKKTVGVRSAKLPEQKAWQWSLS